MLWCLIEILGGPQDVSCLNFRNKFNIKSIKEYTVRRIFKYFLYIDESSGEI